MFKWIVVNNVKKIQFIKISKEHSHLLRNVMSYVSENKELYITFVKLSKLTKISEDEIRKFLPEKYMFNLKKYLINLSKYLHQYKNVDILSITIEENVLVKLLGFVDNDGIFQGNSTKFFWRNTHFLKQFEKFLITNQEARKLFDEVFNNDEIDRKGVIVKLKNFKKFHNSPSWLSVERLFKSYKNAFDELSIYNFTNDEIALLKIFGYCIITSTLKSIDKLPKINDYYNEKGYGLLPDGIFFDSKIKYKNWIFKNIKAVINFLIIEIGIVDFIINDDFVNVLKSKFNVDIIGVRAFSSTLERWDMLIKVDTNHFVPVNDNDQKIASEIFHSIIKSKFNFVNHDIFKVYFNELIVRYNLTYCKWYYLLKKYFEDKLYFSKGNSMYVTKNSRMAEMDSVARIKYYYKIPTVISKFQFMIDTGVSIFANFNFGNVYPMKGDKFFIYDKGDEMHNSHFKNLFLPFFNTKQNQNIFHKEIKDFCTYSNNELLNNLSSIGTFRFLKNAFGTDLSIRNIYVNVDSRNRICYTYKGELFEDEQENYIDINDWSDF